MYYCNQHSRKEEKNKYWGNLFDTKRNMTLNIKMCIERKYINN